MTSQNSQKKHDLCLLAEDVRESEKLRAMIPDMVSCCTAAATNEVAVQQAEVILVTGSRRQWCEQAVKGIRSQPGRFLAPLVAATGQDSEILQGLVDHVLMLPAGGGTLPAVLEKMSAIAQAVSGFSMLPDSLPRSVLNELLVLRYLAAREGAELWPVIDLDAHSAYSYPLVQNLAGDAAGNETELLEGLEEAGLLKGTLRDKVNLCPFCGHYQINFREVCPTCKTMEIFEEAAIHHYQCAYVGRESEFRDGNELKCPKCSRQLRHIGVDYDKPSEDIWCQLCNAHFAEPIISCFCLCCGKIFEPHQAVTRPVKIFTLTPAGRRAAELGSLPGLGLTEFIREEMGLYGGEVFRELYALEVNRCKRYEYESTLLQLVIRNFDELIATEGAGQMERIKKELGALFKSTFRDTDVITNLSENETLIILTHTGEAGARRAVERLQEGTAKIFKKDINVEHAIADLRTQSPSLEEGLAQVR